MTTYATLYDLEACWRSLTPEEKSAVVENKELKPETKNKEKKKQIEINKTAEAENDEE